MPSSSLLVAEELSCHFVVRRDIFGRPTGVVRALNDVDVNLSHGETLGVVGESGCGKTTLGRCIGRLIEPTGGRLSFRGQDILNLRRNELRRLRKDIQTVFQDPFSSLNPRRRIGDAITDAYAIHGLYGKAERRERVGVLLEKVGLKEHHVDRFPHEFSGGQRQRIAIARALALSPGLVILDEAVSALDVSVQAQIINLLIDLKRSEKLTYIFISHNLGITRKISDSIAVMYLGRVVESGPVEEIFESPRHHYTRALIASIPCADPGLRGLRTMVQGEPPSPLAPPPGCAYHTRCPKARPRCWESEPPLVAVDDSEHKVACFHPAEERPQKKSM